MKNFNIFPDNMQSNQVRYFAVIFAAVFSVTLCGCPGNNSDQTTSQQTTLEPVCGTIAVTADESDEYITSLAYSLGTLWIGTEHFVYSLKADLPAEELINSLKPEYPDQRFIKRHDSAVDNSKVNSIYAKDKTVIVASFEGCSTYSETGWSKQPIGNSNEIIPVGDDLWSATNSGLEILRSGSNEWKKLEVASATSYSPTRQMKAICTDGKNTVWVGTLFGLHQFDLAGYDTFYLKLNSSNPGTGKVDNSHFWKRYFGDYQSVMGGMVSNEHGNCPLTGNNIQKIRYDQLNNRFLFCTKNGISILLNNKWKSFRGTGSHMVSSDNGLMNTEQRKGNIDIPTAEVYDALPYENSIFIATRSGLGIIDETSNSTRLLTLEDGLPSNVVTSLAKDSKHKILFIGTASGIGLLKLQ